MGSSQKQFLTEFEQAFDQKFTAHAPWSGGQLLNNIARLPGVKDLRRGEIRRGERFELGDLKTAVGGFTVIVEYDSGGISLSNLLKYWPYIKGELDVISSNPIILCTFSDWKSYGAYRDLWKWLSDRMQADPEMSGSFHAHQFDHGGANIELRKKSIHQALNWLDDTLSSLNAL